MTNYSNDQLAQLITDIIELSKINIIVENNKFTIHYPNGQSTEHILPMSVASIDKSTTKLR